MSIDLTLTRIYMHFLDFIDKSRTISDSLHKHSQPCIKTLQTSKSTPSAITNSNDLTKYHEFMIPKCNSITLKHSRKT